MNLKNFKLNKHKIEKIKYQEIVNDNLFNYQVRNNKQIEKSFQGLKINQILFKKKYLISSNIQHPKEYTSTYNYKFHVFEFEYEIDKIPKEILPYIDCKLLCYLPNEKGLEDDFWVIFTGDYWIEVLNENEDNYNIKLHALYYSSNDTYGLEKISNYTAEIIILITNPYRFS